MNLFAMLCIAFLAGCFCGIKFILIDILFYIFSFCGIYIIKLIVFKGEYTLSPFFIKEFSPASVTCPIAYRPIVRGYVTFSSPV